MLALEARTSSARLSMPSLCAASAAVATVMLLTAGSAAVALDEGRPLEQHSIDVWQMREGLPQNSVFDVLQARDGYLWLATQEGLVRFDGVSFKVFDTSNSPLPRTYLESLHESADGALWFGTYDGGVTRLLRGEFRTYTMRDGMRSEEHTSELQSQSNLVCRLLLEKKKLTVT